jgi:hypothetical protein
MYGCCEDRQLGIALPAVGSIITSVGGIFGAGDTGTATYREDGARWSAKKQYWELPPGTKAAVQSPKPSGPVGTCTGKQSCVQSMQGGPLLDASQKPVITYQDVAPSDPVAQGGVQQYPSVAGLSFSPTPLVIAGAAALAIVFLSRKR